MILFSWGEDMDYHISITQDGVISYPMHKHTFCEIMLYLEGNGYLRTDTENIPFESGTAIIVPQNIMHGSVSEKGFKNISIGGDFKNLLLFDRPVSVKTAADSRILGKLIYDNKFSDCSYLNSLINCYITSLLQTFKASSQTDIAIDKIIKDISTNALNPDFNITSVLNLSGYAEDYIRAKFKGSTGKTPTQFVNLIRVEHACKLIDIYGEEISVSRLSEECGFSNLAYFSRVSKCIKAISPRQYLKSQIH